MRDAESVSYVAVTTTDDGLGNITYDEADPFVLSALVAGHGGANRSPRSTLGEESTSPRTPAVVSALTLYIIESDIVPNASDWFTVRGERWDVEGRAIRWGSMGVEVALIRADVQP